MVFSSYQFLFFFLPITFLVFCSLQKFKNSQVTSLWLLLASVVFYTFWNPRDILPLSFSILINYSVYQCMKRFSRRMLLMWLGIAFNLVFLASYKYLNFGDWHGFKFVADQGIPLGISFYTFTQIAFLVDCYKEGFPQNDIIRYSLFVSYFPHLICGPILSFKQLYPQLSEHGKLGISQRNIALFCMYFSIGVFKKIIIADSLGDYVNQVFDADINTFFYYKTCLWATLSYAVQLYFDFSGYSDMAVGVSKLFGVDIPYNFDAPYKSKSIIEFWRRWHISLSTFLRNYVYIPLGGNRVAPFRLYLNLLIVMILGGIWHGGAWTYVVWGGYHGALLVVNHFWRRHRLAFIVIPERLQNFIKPIFTFLLVCCGWVLFRSHSLGFASNMYTSIFNMDYGIEVAFNQYWILAIGMLYIIFVPDTMRIADRLFAENRRKRSIIATAAACGVMMGVAIMRMGGSVQHFIYSGF
ncbi:MAG: MBOAT family protein [Holosporales bacterium]|jgi:alginate O-acetyltransferase complex protein AlgI|nr:MBOAT family protein [Holosporales bacterium]